MNLRYVNVERNHRHYTSPSEKVAMVPYKIKLYRENGGLHAEETLDFPDDDAVIDHTGARHHPHAIEIWQDNRLVAEVPPLPF